MPVLNSSAPHSHTHTRLIRNDMLVEEGRSEEQEDSGEPRVGRPCGCEGGTPSRVLQCAARAVAESAQQSSEPSEGTARVLVGLHVPRRRRGSGATRCSTPLRTWRRLDTACIWRRRPVPSPVTLSRAVLATVLPRCNIANL